jgi:holo-[acyl-carrier protein] synthase
MMRDLLEPHPSSASRRTLHGRTAIGVDIVSVDKIRAILDHHAHASAALFTGIELASARSGRYAAELFAARFAAKEAVLKALGTGLAKGMTWHDIEVRKRVTGEPVLHLSGAVAEKATLLGLEKWLVSLTHSREFAVAFVMASGPRPLRCPGRDNSNDGCVVRSTCVETKET